MVIKGTVEKVGNNKLIVSKKPYSYVLVTSEEQLPQLCIGDRIKVKGEWYKKHYLKHDFTIGTVMAVNASSIQTL